MKFERTVTDHRNVYEDCGILMPQVIRYLLRMINIKVLLMSMF